MAKTQLKALPSEERPRERLLSEGVSALSLTELLAIFLTNGTKGKSVLDLAEELLIHFGGWPGVLEASVAELTQIKGIGEIKAIQLKAIFGLVQKSARISNPEKCRLRTTQEVFELARVAIGYEKQEILLVILRDVRGCVIHQEQ